MKNTWFISDTHFGHANIIKYSNRPYSHVDEMNEALIQNWNALVKPDDIIYHLGDFAFMQWRDFSQMVWKLNGHIQFIRGNHDKMIDQHEVELLRSGKIETIQNYLEIKPAGQMIVLFHYGQRVWNKSHHGSIHLYGHSHGSLPPHGKSVDVGVDCKEITAEYRPIHLDEVTTYMSKRTFEAVDHHGD